MRVPRWSQPSLAGGVFLLAAWAAGALLREAAFPGGDGRPGAAPPGSAGRSVPARAGRAGIPRKEGRGPGSRVAAEEAPDGPVLEVEVVEEIRIGEEDRRPVADAEVEFTLADGRVLLLRTGGDGTVSLPAPATPFLVVARAKEGIASCRCGPESGAPESLWLRLRPTTIARGSVATMEGSGIPGAVVIVWSEPFGPEDDYLLRGPAGWPLHAAQALFRARADGTGAFEVHLPRFATLFVTAEAPGRAASCRRVHASDFDGEARLDLWLSEAGTVDGRISDPAGAPAAGARVLLVPGDACVTRRGGILGWMDQPLVREVFADALGRYAFGDAPVDSSFHLVALRGDLGATEPARARWIPPAAGSLRQDLEFRTAGRVVVRTTEPEAVLVDEEGGEWGMASLAEEGGDGWRCEAAGLPPGNYRVRAGDGREFRITGEVIAVRGGVAEDRRVEAAPRVSISGRILDTEGAPIVALKVWAWRPGDEAGEGEPGDGKETDEQGCFTIGGLLTVPHDIHADCGDGTTRLARAVETPSSDLEFRIPAPGRLRFRPGVPPGDEERKAEFAILWRDSGGRPCSRTGEGRPGEDGFDLRGIGPGPGRLVVFVPGRAPLERDYDLLPGGDLDLGILGMVRGRTLSGRVVDDLGTPHEGVRVFQELHGNRYRDEEDGVTDEGGRFVLRNALAGDLVLAASCPCGHADGRVVVPAGGDAGDVLLVLARYAWVRGRLSAPTGRPVAGEVTFFRGALAGEEDGTEAADSDARGWYGLWLEPGTVRAGARGPGGEWADLGSFELKPGEVRTLDFTVPE